jgi:hypothetical protein
MTVTAMRSQQESFDSARHRARGGRELYTGLLRCPAEWGYRQVLRAITQPKEASNGLHRSVGVHGPGLYRRVAWKHDRLARHGASIQLDLFDSCGPDGLPGPIR